MDIKIITHQGFPRNFVMNKADTLMDLKMKIRDYFGLSFEEQILLFDNRTLDLNDQKLSEYGLLQGCSVKLLLNVIKECFTINVLVFGNTSFDVEIRAKDTLSEVKEKIRNHCRICPDEQILTFHGRLLEGDENISSYGVEDNNTIIVIRKLAQRIQIFVKARHTEVTIEVSRNDQIIDVKDQINEKIGLSPDAQQLSYQGERLEDNQTVEYYDIGNMDTILVLEMIRFERLRLRNRIQIFVKVLHKRVIIEVSRNDQIIDVKDQIHEKIGLSQVKQGLCFQGEILEDNQTVEYYDIENMDTVLVLEIIRY